MDFNPSEIISKLLVDLEESWQLPSRFYVKNLQIGMVISFEYGIYGKTINGWSVARVVCRATALVVFFRFFVFWVPSCISRINPTKNLFNTLKTPNKKTPN